MIHQYQFGGYNIVLDVCSGSVHVVDEAAYQIIAGFETQERSALLTALEPEFAQKGVTRADLEECYDQVLALKDQGKLFAPDVFEKDAGTLKAKRRRRHQGAVPPRGPHLQLKLRVLLCQPGQVPRRPGHHVSGGGASGRWTSSSSIPGPGRTWRWTSFGGEPLMNFQMIKDLVAYARTLEPLHHKHFRFTLTTNGVLVDDDVIDFANRECDNVVLSLDGRQEVHDRYRVDYAGNGSWEKIVPKFQEFVRRRGDKSYYMRGTFTHFNPDFLKDIETMLDLGFTELSMEPVVAAPGDEAALHGGRPAHRHGAV